MGLVLEVGICVKTYGAGGGVRTHELLRERITYRDPIVCYDLKSAAFDRAWLLPLGSVRQAKSAFSRGTHRVASVRHADSSTLWCGIVTP